jgi:phosphopantothenoylcysteine decarboxylase/phosphopantothenate--cysteine ligase
MRVLITSGGTKVPIDRVRDITNLSRGTFGSRIAQEALAAGHEVTLLRAEGSRTPFSSTLDFYGDRDLERASKRLTDLYNFCEKHRQRYVQFTYRNFADYHRRLERLVTGGSTEPARSQPDIVILAAAVSDYGVTNFFDGKVRSADNLQISLAPLPKLIGKVKLWAPNCFLVGFKLLVNSTPEELYGAAQASIDKNGCGLVVANDLRDIQQGDHCIMLVFPGKKEAATYRQSQKPDDPNYLARLVVQAATETTLCPTSSSA